MHTRALWGLSQQTQLHTHACARVSGCRTQAHVVFTLGVLDMFAIGIMYVGNSTCDNPNTLYHCPQSHDKFLYRRTEHGATDLFVCYAGSQALDTLDFLFWMLCA